MSGTKAYIERQKREMLDRQVRLQNVYKAKEEREKNSLQTKATLEAFMKEITGWQNLDDWLLEAVEKWRKGEYVDLSALNTHYEEWKAQNKTEA